MDTRRLRAFVTTAELGSVSAAAEQLGYAQSTLSNQLQALEHELGSPLLRRGSVGTEPTEAGQRVLPLARQALALEDQMRRAAQSLAPRLRLGAHESLAAEWLPDLLTALHRGAEGPGTDAEVTLSVGPRAQLEAELAAGRLDAVFVYDNGHTAPGRYESTPVARDRGVLAASPAHPLARRGGVREEDVLSAEFLIAEPGCTSAMLFERFGMRVAPRTPIGNVTGSLSALRRMAVHGLGVALVPSLAVARELEAGELVELDLTDSHLPGITIEARWTPNLGPAETPLKALLRLARRHPAGVRTRLGREAVADVAAPPRGRARPTTPGGSPR